VSALNDGSLVVNAINQAGSDMQACHLDDNAAPLYPNRNDCGTTSETTGWAIGSIAPTRFMVSKSLSESKKQAHVVKGLQGAASEEGEGKRRRLYRNAGDHRAYSRRYSAKSSSDCDCPAAFARPNDRNYVRLAGWHIH